MLRRATWWDPREDADLGVVDSVNIPLSQIGERIYELPRRSDIVRIPDLGSIAHAAKLWLEENERMGVIGADFKYGETASGRLWSPNAFLESSVVLAQDRKALDIACGSGRDAVFLADCGYTVIAVDHLADALQMGENLAERYLRAPDRVQWLQKDLESEAVEGYFDLITCFFFLDRRLLQTVPNLLNPGGSVVMETFTKTHQKTHGKPRSDRFVLMPDELRTLLPGLDIRFYEEGWHGDRHTARIVAFKAES